MTNPIELIRNYLNPLRRIREFRTADTPQGERLYGDQNKEIVENEDGAIVTTSQTKLHFYDCGHSSRGPEGGRCQYEGCGSITCEVCFQLCFSCGIGLAPCHQISTIENGQRIVLCEDCHNDEKYRRVWKFLGSFFIEKG